MKQEELIGQRVRAALSSHQWRQSDLVRATGLDKNTISAIANGRQRASDATLGRIETAFGMTPGTLAAAGEDTPDTGPAPALAGASPEDLLAALTHKVLGLREENARLQERIEQLEAQPAVLALGDSPASRANRLEAHLPTWAATEAARTGEKAADREGPGEEDFSQDPEDYSNRGGDNE